LIIQTFFQFMYKRKYFPTIDISGKWGGMDGGI